MLCCGIVLHRLVFLFMTYTKCAYERISPDVSFRSTFSPDEVVELHRDRYNPRSSTAGEDASRYVSNYASIMDIYLARCIQHQSTNIVL